MNISNFLTCNKRPPAVLHNCFALNQERPPTGAGCVVKHFPAFVMQLFCREAVIQNKTIRFLTIITSLYHIA